MPLFDATVPRRLLWPPDASWPRRRARAVVGRFQARFPELAYDIDLDVELANAQAFLDGRTRRVRLYGGLVRHRRIGSAGLAVVLAHETGHHLGGPPYLVPYRWLSSEDSATAWAKSVGIVEVFGSAQAARIWRQGQLQLEAIAPR